MTITPCTKAESAALNRACPVFVARIRQAGPKVLPGKEVVEVRMRCPNQAILEGFLSVQAYAFGLTSFEILDIRKEFLN
jgi:hypothetical protein